MLKKGYEHLRYKHFVKLNIYFKSRLAGKYRWWEFPAVITGNYRPGKYSKFCLSGKYEIFRNIFAKIFYHVSLNLS